ncbi:Ribokinase [Rubellimicrobium mesophilum DSM 19309]|uniref:Ribokinase n=1 Tax=Rubellimicrobium mesophilum DSM 19309 TaxID=442562 RepID=A0A017HQ31_9RHOB|nr:ribokinase [Rubellimicrobium mesophilum]EYD75879.1 Ribokinase [Rubellimicrobium mesophilum DSM 19309]
MPGPIVILGIFVADTAYRAPRQPRMGETILGEGFKLGPGGKGSNQAVAAARAGGDVHLVSRLARDAFGDLALKTWAEAGVTPEVTRTDDGYTGAAYIFVESGSGDNAIIVAPGVAGDISEEDIDARADLIRSASVFVTQLEQPLPAAIRALQIAREAGVTTVLNPAPAAPLPDGTLALCDWLTPNESEAEALTGLPVTDPATAEAAARTLILMGAGGVVVTLGAQGAMLVQGDRAVHLPAIDAGPVVETTGAGDAFNGGFAVALSEGRTPEEAVRFGIATAGISVTRPGTAPSMPSREEIEAALRA